MNRVTVRSLIATVALLATIPFAATANATPPKPVTGPFSGPTSQKNIVSLSVSAAGSKVELITASIQFNCSYEGAQVPLNETINSKYFKPGEKGKPLAVKHGKFSYKGSLYISSNPVPTINFTGTVKSPKKISGKISIGAFTAEVAPGITSPCDAASVTFTAKHS